MKEPVVVSELNTSQVLRRYWQKSGLEALKKVLGDGEVAKKVFNELPLDSYTPGAMITEGRKMLKEKSLRELLPEPINPPEMIDVVREMAIAYLSRGPEGVGKVLMKIRSDDIKTRAAVYAFIQAFSLQKYSSWSYSPEEIGYAQGLERVIKEVVTEDPKKHMEGLKRLWKETGSTRELKFRERS
ncbi:MAG: hypothetical protein J7L88_05315 [Thermoplasmata archaeon]|nr:hypothetical protein [Thermoplasmata archaeon]